MFSFRAGVLVSWVDELGLSSSSRLQWSAGGIIPILETHFLIYPVSTVKTKFFLPILMFHLPLEFEEHLLLLESLISFSE